MEKVRMENQYQLDFQLDFFTIIKKKIIKITATLKF